MYEVFLANSNEINHFRNKCKVPNNKAVSLELNVDDSAAISLGNILNSSNQDNQAHTSNWNPLDEAAHNLLRKLKFFQDRMYKANPTKAHAKQRLVFGIKGVERIARNDGLKCIMVASDFEGFQEPIVENPLSQLLESVKSYCCSVDDPLDTTNCKPPLVKVSNKRKLSHILNKSGRVSVVGLLDIGGAEELFQNLLKEWRKDSIIETQSIG
ncbi:selenocysteine insertion sequence-binding protein 2 [Ditylenchus destructor]|uniref:Selenocysteine insertion sequence-binding protein 2 n=1 Tax=Ditylenchus destructor TaxID=166010 RepID=A0AAD4NFR4_9BILA|nr:selenocysteine insertion sequence-binding protein 2 [Ditylenchus destructor]